MDVLISPLLEAKPGLWWGIPLQIITMMQSGDWVRRPQTYPLGQACLTGGRLSFMQQRPRPLQTASWQARNFLLRESDLFVEGTLVGLPILWSDVLARGIGTGWWDYELRWLTQTGSSVVFVDQRQACWKKAELKAQRDTVEHLQTPGLSTMFSPYEI